MKKVQGEKLLILEFVIMVLMIISSMIILQIRGIAFFVFMQIFFCVYVFCITKKICFFKEIFINMIFIEILISAAVACFSNVPISYKKSAIYITILLFPVYFTTAYINSSVMRKQEILDVIKKAIQIMCLIQLIWCVVQFLLSLFFKIDINEILFVQVFHFVEKGSSIQNGLVKGSGLSWHPALMAPVFVFSYVLFDSMIVKGLIIIDAVVCGNSTALLGVLACIGLDMLQKVVKVIKKKRFNGLKVLIVGSFCLIGVFFLIKTGFIYKLVDKIIYTYYRITGVVNDGGSALAHKRYFTAYPEVLKISTPLQIIFGYGEGGSGYPFGILFNQYSTLSSWAVESDIMNILISRGIVGFLCYYSFLGYIAVKGSKINFKYVICIVVLIIEGITYNIQFDWVFMLEIIMLICIKNQYDFFGKRE